MHFKSMWEATLPFKLKHLQANGGYGASSPPHSRRDTHTAHNLWIWPWRTRIRNILWFYQRLLWAHFKLKYPFALSAELVGPPYLRSDDCCDYGFSLHLSKIYFFCCLQEMEISTSLTFQLKHLLKCALKVSSRILIRNNLTEASWNESDSGRWAADDSCCSRQALPQQSQWKHL